MTTPLSYATRKSPEIKPERRGVRWLGRYWLLPVTVLFVLLPLTWTLRSEEQINENDQIQRDEASYRVASASRLEDVFWNDVRPVLRHWSSGDWRTSEGFLADAQSLRVGQPDILALGWIDGTGRCAAWDSAPGNHSLLGENLAANPQFSAMLQKVQGTDRGVLGPVIDDPVYGPVVFGAYRGTAGQVQGPPATGAIIFEIRIQSLVGGITNAEFNRNFELNLSDGSKTIFGLPTSGNSRDEQANKVRMLDRIWSLRLTPTQAFLSIHPQRSLFVMLWLFMAAAMLMVAYIYQAMHERHRELRHMKQYLSALELLSETSAAIGAKVGAGGEVLARLPEAARTVMGMSLASISVLENGGASMRVIASTGVQPSLEGEKFRLDELPMAAQCIQTRQAVTVPDIRANPELVNPTLISRYQLRSLMLVPLLIGPEVIGLLLLGRTEALQFTPEDVRLAELWSAQAAVTLANDRLYDRTRQALDALNHLLAQRDALFGAASAIALAGPMQEVLQRITDVSPKVLEMDVCLVNLITEDPELIEVAAITSQYAASLIGTRYKIEHTNTQQVLSSRQVLVVQDSAGNPMLKWISEAGLPSGSVVYFPLFNSVGAPIGVLVLLRRQSGPISPVQLGLTEMFSIKAASAIENAKLIDQTRRDADAKAALLRELNHRVKNNLAGIVALLSLAEPELSPEARQWLDRVIDRVRTMSRTHEMFTGGMERVHLKQLIGQTINSLSVAKPASVAMTVEMEGPDLFLRTDRAVSVAMVLHELCFNALVHGVSEGGRVVIRVTRETDRLLIIEITDPGRDLSHDAIDTSGLSATIAIIDKPGTRLGLSLVRGFVSRELRGRFSLSPNPSGGMTARVEIPLLDDETDQARP